MLIGRRGPYPGACSWILHFDPQTGHEQRGRRPAVVVSNRSFY
ncbi:MAG: type II toxin-antitoxin system PemK/MazF family toxin [Spirochaetaceae bacterium]|nr:type II toxin-antitoxin system PemK/MazF family toxin [Spirochaetaceae bacterium]